MNNEKRLTGVLEVKDDGYGILQGTGEGDAYLSPSLIRNHSLCRGDRISGLAEFYPTSPGAIKAQMVSVDMINGQEIKG